MTAVAGGVGGTGAMTGSSGAIADSMGSAFLGAVSGDVVFLVGILFSSFHQSIVYPGKSITTYGFLEQTLQA
jgi:hypothetical protein